jgi:hypothetical protein
MQQNKLDTNKELQELEALGNKIVDINCNKLPQKEQEALSAAVNLLDDLKSILSQNLESNFEEIETYLPAVKSDISRLIEKASLFLNFKKELEKRITDVK